VLFDATFKEGKGDEAMTYIAKTIVNQRTEAA
jgi:hypothetical protein